MAPDRELLHVIKELKNTLINLNKNYQERRLPVTDGSQELQPFCAQLEFLLQYDLKEKKNLFGQKKDYWDFLSRNLTRLYSDPHAGVQHVTSLEKLKTAVGKGRAFIRYCLVHQQLAETLQLCFMEPEVTSEWYYARSPFLDQKLWTDILSSLYELDGIAFHLALRREDLDTAWPTVSEVLPQFSTRTTNYTQSEDGSSKVGNSGQEHGLHQGSTLGHRSELRTMDQYVTDSSVASSSDQLRPGLEQPLEKWIGVWRSRKNSLLQMGSLLKLNPFMERYIQCPPSSKEQKRANGDLQVYLEKLEKEQPGSMSSSQGLNYPQSKHCLCRKVEGIMEDDSLWKQQDLRTLIGELSVLQQKLALQQEENASLKQTLSEENCSLKEELIKYEEQQEEKISEQKKQQQEMAKLVKALREAEYTIANLTGECQEAQAKKDAVERSLKEAEQRLSSQEAERRKHLAHMKAQELKQQQQISRCQELQEKLRVCEESLERWEVHVAAMKSQHGQLETIKELSEEKYCRVVEREEYSTILEIDPFKEKLERSFAEIKHLEKEKETLMETLVSQEQGLVFSKLEIKDLQKELLVCQEHIVTLQVSLEKQEKAQRDHEKSAQSLQRELSDQSACLKETLKKNTTLEAQLEEMANKKFQLEAETLEEQSKWERTLQALTAQLSTFEKEVVRLQEERQQLQAALQQALGEREVLAKQAESDTASLEGQTREITWLRSELETVKATSQTLQKTQQDKSESIASALREECLKLKNQVEQLQQEKTQATNIAKKLREELQQCWKCPTEDDVLQRALVPSTTVTDLACESKSKETRGPIKERGIVILEKNHEIARSPLTEKEIQAYVLQDLERPGKKGDNTKQRTEVHEKGQHYEEEKRALSHEIIALNNHLIEAKVTIDKLSEDNELYRKDCNLAAQLLQCSKNYDRAHKLSELPAEFQERVSIHLEKHGCSLSVPLCHTSFADNIPTCVIAKVLEKPDPNTLSPHMSSPSSRDLAFQESVGKLGQRPQYKTDIYCSDTALYCPEERRRERRQSVDMQVKGVGFLRSQNSTDSTVEEDGFHSSFSHEAFPEYVTSLPTSSSYSSFSVTSEEKENAQASTLTASQQAIYLSSRDEMFERKPSSGYDQGSPRFAKAKSIQHMELADDNENSPTFTRTMSPYASEPYHFSAITTQQALASQKMRTECRNTHLSEEDLPGQWRQLSVEDIGAYSYRNSGRLSPCSFSEQYYRSPVKKGDSQSSPIYASYKGDSFSEGDDICQSRLVDSCFLRTDSGLNIDISTSCKLDKLSSYKTKELRDKKSERITVQMCSSKSIDGSPVLKREYVDVSPNSSAESLNQSSMEASEIHQSSIEQGSHSSLHSKQQQFQRTGSTGLSRKDSLTKAQLYGTLLN